MFFRSSNLGKSICVTIGSIVVLVLLLACVSMTFQHPSVAVGNKDGFYYSQLDENSKIFYDALQYMNSKGNFKTGTTEYDISDKISSEQAKAYANGDNSILESFATAKDAFLLENNVFYVDFSKLQLSIGIQDNNYVVTIGTGRNDDFYSAGFAKATDVDTALDDYKTKLSEIVTFANNGTTVEQKIQRANTKILETTTFGYGINDLDNTITDKAKYITTNYGALYKGTAVYEGFARLFRDVLNELSIENVLVSGYVLNSNESFVPAMWNYVKIGTNWYAINAGLNSQNTENSQEFLLVGQNTMKYRHYTSAQIVNSAYAFSYPELSETDYGFVGEVAVDYSFNNSTSIFNVSYLGKNATESAKDNLYLAFRVSQSDFDIDSPAILWGNWVAISVAIADEDGAYKSWLTEKTTETTLTLPNTESYIQFAVINSAPTNTETGEYDTVMNENIVSQSAELVNKNRVNASGDRLYSPAPCVKKVEPSSAVLDADKTYTMVFVFDESLCQKDSTSPVKISVKDVEKNSLGEIASVTWNSNLSPDTLVFTFTPSSRYNDNYQYYIFEIENLIGSKSSKAPIPVSIICEKNSISLSNGAQNISSSTDLTLNEFNQLDLTDWTFTTENNKSQIASNEFSSQLNFVSSKLNSHDTESIVDQIKKDNATINIVESAGYEIGLNLCGGKVTFMNGQTVKISKKITSQNASYRAFVCPKDEDGALLLGNISEAKCFIHNDELTIEVNKFGALVLLETNTTSQIAGERVLFIKNINGNGAVSAKINGVAQTDIISLKLGESVAIEFTSNLGYKLESCLLSGKTLKTTDNKVIISYNDLRATNVMDVCFVSTRVANYETTKGLQNLQSEFLVHQFTPNGINWGLWVTVGVCAVAVIALLIVWIVVVARNKKREKIARELGI